MKKLTKYKLLLSVNWSIVAFLFLQLFLSLSLPLYLPMSLPLVHLPLAMAGEWQVEKATQAEKQRH